MAVYAAFEFPTWYVEEALLTGGGEVGACNTQRVPAGAGTLGMGGAPTSACLYASDVRRASSAMRLRLSRCSTAEPPAVL